ncbi:MAG: YciI family protein [Janthinobacterium lividum]
MPQFLVTAHDGIDAEAPARRVAARPAHLAGIGKLGGAMILGGAMLDATGAPTGSTMVVEFPDRTDLDAWLAADPYTVGGVWRRVEVVPFRVAVERGTAG